MDAQPSPRTMELLEEEPRAPHTQSTWSLPWNNRSKLLCGGIAGIVVVGALFALLPGSGSGSDDLPPAVPDGGPYPAKMKVEVPGLVDTGPYEYYSGFLDAGVPPSGEGRMYFHYICAMAPDWQRMPLTFWYNGGPGAPSTYGLFQEFGPFLLTEASLATPQYASTGIPTPIYNPWTWANVTSICEIDSPAPMGASFCTDGNGTGGSAVGPAGDAYSCGPWTDTATAAANHEAHVAFFRDAFPEFADNNMPVSIVGESYAGVYVPLFVNAWLDDPIKGPNGKEINFRGFAVGDGMPACIEMEGRPVDWCVNLTNVEFFRYPNVLPGPYWDVEFFHGHSQMSEALYHDIQSTCKPEELTGESMPLSADCEKLVTQRMSAEVGYFFAYNLYEACPREGRRLSAQQRELWHARRMLAGSAHPSLQMPLTATPGLTPTPGYGDTGLGAQCLGNVQDQYFDLDDVKISFGIPLSNQFIVLDNGIGMNYTTNRAFVGDIYEKAVKAGKRVLVYEGDTDACGLQTAPIEDVWVPFFGNGTGKWTPVGPLNNKSANPLGLSMTQTWRPFSVNASRQVQGGYVMEWANGQVSFVSIRGAGHLAPLYRPAASFTMMQAFQKEASLPPGFYP